jgi:hypothetical protein
LLLNVGYCARAGLWPPLSASTIMCVLRRTIIEHGNGIWSLVRAPQYTGDRGSVVATGVSPLAIISTWEASGEVRVSFATAGMK